MGHLKRVKFSSRVGLSIVMFTVLSACVPLTFFSFRATELPNPTVTTSPGAPLILTSTPCGYMWAYRPAPTNAANLRATLQAAGFQNSVVDSAAFGETGGPRCNFNLMSYDVNVTISDPTIKDNEELGNAAAKVLALLRGSGKVRLTINGNGVSFSGMFMYSQAQALLDKGLKGRALIEALQNP